MIVDILVALVAVAWLLSVAHRLARAADRVFIAYHVRRARRGLRVAR